MTLDDLPNAVLLLSESSVLSIDLRSIRDGDLFGLRLEYRDALEVELCLIQLQLGSN